MTVPEEVDRAQLVTRVTYSGPSQVPGAPPGVIRHKVFQVATLPSGEKVGWWNWQSGHPPPGGEITVP